MADGFKIAVSFWDVLTDLGYGIAWTRDRDKDKDMA
jgi:hypothetical protein